MAGFSWRVNGVPASSVQGSGIPEDQTDPPAQIPKEYGDTYLQKVTKIVPVEIVGAYLLALQIVPTFPEAQRQSVLIMIFLGGFLLTIGAMTIGRGLYKRKKLPDGTFKRDGNEVVQIVLAVIAFSLWAYLQGGVFAVGPTRTIPWFGKELWSYSPGLGVLAVIVFGTALNWFNPPKVIEPEM